MGTMLERKAGGRLGDFIYPGRSVHAFFNDGNGGE